MISKIVFRMLTAGLLLGATTGAAWASIPEATANDVDRAVRAAREAFEGDWRKTTPRQRGRGV